MQLTSQAAAVLTGSSAYWLRLEFGYDCMGRRISKGFLQIESVWRDFRATSGKIKWGERRASSMNKAAADVARPPRL